MKAAVVVFPGSNCDQDCFHVLRDVAQCKVDMVWHKEPLPGAYDLIVLPGGFSYGDYLRTGAIARFSPVMQDVVKHATTGRPIIGICNGFQILLEAGLLPGAMLRNRSLSFICKHVDMRVENTNTPFTNQYKKHQVIRLPIAHGEGNYFCDHDTLKFLHDRDRVMFRYSSPDGKVTSEFNPNGAIDNIAGILNDHGNVLGMMPHPERASEDILNDSDGNAIWQSLISAVGV